VHPIGACVGGFHRLPDTDEIHRMLTALYEARGDARALVGWTAGLKLPEDEQDFCSVSLSHPDEYPMNEGRLISSLGLDIAIEDYQQHFDEFQVPYSTALHSHLDSAPYLVGPLARLNLNLERLPASVRSVLDETGISFPGKNMFHSIVARAVELLYAVEESIAILEARPDTSISRVTVQPRAGVGFGCTEAPRGTLWHRYEVGQNGQIKSARIVPPTSQNQARIEQDLRTSLQAFGLGKDEIDLRLHAEMVIRNYDPCISCATHFLKLKLERH
jgi:sulfhydrogenase subunit alpha